jgi:regulator of replication initiation timing
MSYIDNTKGNMMKEIYILELENEMLRKQITKLKLELNELLDNAKSKGQHTNNEGDAELRREDNSKSIGILPNIN